MKKTIKHIINHSLFVLALVAVVVFGCRCTTTKPDPLAGWQIAFKEEPNQVIAKDCQDYIQKQNLSPQEGKYVAYIEFLKDGTGQRAEKITISLNQTDWVHVLIYDKDNKRIKTIKYISGHSRS